MNNLRLPLVRLERSKQDFAYVAVKNWNSIPKNIVNMKNMFLFKNILRNFILIVISN